MGRPSKYTAELAERICKRIERGDYIETAAGAEGIARSTLYLWMENKPGFSDAIACARATAESSMVAELRCPTVLTDKGAVDSAHQASLRWLLERTRRDRFGQVIELRAREEAARDILEQLRDKLDGDEYARVWSVLVGNDGEAGPPDRPVH